MLEVGDYCCSAPSWRGRHNHTCPPHAHGWSHWSSRNCTRTRSYCICDRQAGVHTVRPVLHWDVDLTLVADSCIAPFRNANIPQLGNKIEGPTVIFGDNKACLTLCASQQPLLCRSPLMVSIIMLLKRWGMGIFALSIVHQWTKCLTYSLRQYLVLPYYAIATTWA